MKDLIKNLFTRNAKKTPEKVRSGFSMAFPDALNAEWSQEGDYWEAVFYLDQKEKIAKMDKFGKLEETRTNTLLSELPEGIKGEISKKGEIMNAIFIEKGSSVSWEIIYRNAQLVRFVCNLDDTGKEISCRQL